MKKNNTIQIDNVYTNLIHNDMVICAIDFVLGKNNEKGNVKRKEVMQDYDIEIVGKLGTREHFQKFFKLFNLQEENIKDVDLAIKEAIDIYKKNKEDFDNLHFFDSGYQKYKTYKLLYSLLIAVVFVITCIFITNFLRSL